MLIDARNEVTNPNGFKPLGNVIGLAVHHSVTSAQPDYSEAQERAHIRTIDAYHVQQGFGGFGYHGATFPSGRSYWCGNGQRAHVKGRNHELWGWCLIGYFSDHLPPLTSPQMQAARQAILELAGSLPIKGHSDWALPGEGTACPGLLGAVDWRSSVWTQPLNQPTAKELTLAGLKLAEWAANEWGLGNFPHKDAILWAAERMK